MQEIEKRLTIILALLLTSCASGSVTPYALEPVSPQEAQRMIDRATNTAQAQATTNAYATATRVVIMQSTQDARSQVEYDKQQAAHATLTEMDRQRKGSELEAARIQITQVAKRAADDDARRRRGDQESAAWNGVLQLFIQGSILVFIIGTVGVIGLGLIYARLYADYAKERRQAEDQRAADYAKELHEAELFRLRIKALAEAVYETGQGESYLLTDDRHPILLNASNAQPFTITRTPEEYQAALNENMNEAPNETPPPVIETRAIPYRNLKGNKFLSMIATTEEDARAQMLQLIDHSILWWQECDPDRATRATVAPSMKIVKGWRKLQEIDSRWNSDMHKRIKSYFGDYLLSQSGIGSWARDDARLWEIKGRLKRGDIRVTLDAPSPAPVAI